MKKSKYQDYILFFIYIALYLFIAVLLMVKQPFGNPPDEYNRYLIPKFIANHGTLPNGFFEEIRIYGYGFSYGFQPILPYMAQGYLMRFAKLFTESDTALLMVGRSVNVLSGLIMAGVIWLLSKEWFKDRRLSSLFAYTITFLPQALLVHTYVNTDSFCMLSISIMLYALTLGFKNKYRIGDCILLSVGIIICALSYYNAYGYILSSIFLFSAAFIDFNLKRFVWKEWLKKGLFISALVLAGIAWWFIRSYNLYDGDILGLATRDYCASYYATPEFHPDTRVTWQNQGYSLFAMLSRSDYLTTLMMSSIGVYGAMSITGSVWMYRFYRVFFVASVGMCIALASKNKKDSLDFLDEKPGLRTFFHINMIFCIAVPILLTMIYSYTTDFQPQGRYILPSLIPVVYYGTRGLEKMIHFPTNIRTKKAILSNAVILLLHAGILFFLFQMVFCYALPFYAANPVAI